MYEHIGACFAILYAIRAIVVWHVGAIALCFSATASVTSALHLALLIGGL